MKNLITCTYILFAVISLHGQQSAIANFESTTQGILIPRMTETDRGAIGSPENGLLVFDITHQCIFYYDQPNTTWIQLRPGIFQHQNDLIFGGDSNDHFILADEQTGFNGLKTQTIGGIAGLNSKLFFMPDKAAFRAAATDNDIANPNFGAFETSAIGAFSTGFGLNNKADGLASSVPGGAGNRASGIAAITAGGEGNVAHGIHTATVGGAGNRAHDMSAVAIGRYNIPGNGSDSTWVETDRLFTIGNGDSDVARSNAVTVLKNGNTTITGDTSTFHLVGPTSIYGYHAKINFGDANYVYLKEYEDDKLEIYARNGVRIRGLGSKMVNPASLTASSNTQTYHASATSAFGISFNPEFFDLSAPISLPDGVRIYQVTLWYDDTNVSDNLLVHIVRNLPGSTTLETISSLSSAGSAGSGSTIDFSTLNNLIDNTTYNYTIRVNTTSNSSWTSDIKFNGVRIDYF